MLWRIAHQRMILLSLHLETYTFSFLVAHRIFFICITTSIYCIFLILHAQREQGKVIGVGVHIYIYKFVNKKKLNRTLTTFSNIRGRTSRRNYNADLLWAITLVP